MGKEMGGHFGIKGVIEFVRRKFERVNPVAASLEGPELTADEKEEQHLVSLPGTKRHADAARGDIPFDDLAEHRKRRGLK